ncbi:MAG: esterase family protein [Verrucomicrobia bacterium]|nr:esterase family protein [Verrucomicrobiota bacterium]
MKIIIVLLSLGCASLAAQTSPTTTKVPGTGDENGWVTPPVEAPGVAHRVFRSASLKCDVSYHLYRPAAYDRDKDARFPVLYWLHGSGGGLEGVAPLAKFFNAAIQSGKVRPFLVVFVNGLPQGMYVDWKDGSTPIESMIMTDLLPHIDATYRTLASREGRMLDGFSMGGYGAARLGFKYPEAFRAVSMLGAGPLDPDFERTPRSNPRSRDGLLERVYGDRIYFREVSPWEIAARKAKSVAKDSLVRIAIGDKDGSYSLNVEFHDHLTKLGIPHGWHPLKGVDHQAMRTLQALGDAQWDFMCTAFGKPEAKSDSPQE